MKGTLEGDFSRFSFDPEKRYSSVRMQQGRVQLDADWNEQADILDHRLRTGLADLIGGTGAPAEEAGFGLTPVAGLELAPGGHFLLLGGPEGCLPLEVSEEESDFTLEIRLVPTGDGEILSLLARSEEDARARRFASLALEGGRLELRRPDAEVIRFAGGGDLTGRLVHLALVGYGRGVALYLDGRPVGLDKTGLRLLPKRTYLRVGSREAPHLPGLFCELRLWSARRSPEQIARSRGRARDGEEHERHLLGHWRFDELEGTHVHDRGPLGNHALLRGGGTSPPRRALADLEIGAGRYYVDGVLCESPAAVPFTAQPDAPGALLPRGGGGERFLFYLDVWERSVSAVEDPDLREIALGGPDTTTRSRVVAQVRSLALAPEEAELDERWRKERWPRLVDRFRVTGGLAARRRQPETAPLDNVLYRVEIHDAGDGRRGRGTVRGNGVLLEGWDGGWHPGQVVEIRPDTSAGSRGAAPRWVRVTEADAGRKSLAFDASPGRSGEAVEVRRIATFKWSRSNASVTFPVGEVDREGGLVHLDPSARATRGLELGAWVELVDDDVVLRRLSEPLCCVKRLDSLRQEVELAPPPSRSTSRSEHPYLRRWDQRGKGLTSWGVVPADGGWQELEAGIEVRFAHDGPYRSGDFWLMPARTLAQDIEWPRAVDGSPRECPPHGVEHRYAPLALLSFGAEGFELTDLRSTFHSRTTGAVSKEGDWMEGPLDVRADLDVEGRLHVDGESVLHGGMRGRLLSEDVVDTPQLVDGSVTLEKLAPAVGTVPPGCFILGPTPEAPPGYAATGLELPVSTGELRWRERREIPCGPAGPLVGAAVGGGVYTLLESGELWRYEPRADRWVRRESLPYSRRGFAAAVLDGKLWVCGGLDAADRATGLLFEYDPERDRWTERASLATARSSFGLVACEGRLHALGGRRDAPLGPCVTARHEAYDPVIDRWSPRRPLPRRLCSMGVGAVGDRVSVVGGESRWIAGRWVRVLSGEHYQYHPGSDRWLARRAPLPKARRDVRLVAVGGRLAAVGGRAALGWTADCELYDPVADSWETQRALPEIFEAPGAAVLGGAIYVTGSMLSGLADRVLLEECRFADRLYVYRREPPPEEPIVEQDTLGAPLPDLEEV